MDIHEAIATELTHFLGGRLKGYRAATECFYDEINRCRRWGVSIWRKHRRLVGVTLHSDKIAVGDYYQLSRKATAIMPDPKFLFYEYEDPGMIDKILVDAAARVARRSPRPPRVKGRI